MATRTKKRATADASAEALPTNREIADELLGIAQLLSARRENPFKIKAYRRAAETILHLSDSVSRVVVDGGDLTAYSGIGRAIAGAIEERVRAGESAHLRRLRSETPAELVALGQFPRLDPRRVQQAYKKLKISSVDALREALDRGAVEAAMGVRAARHFRMALSTEHEILLYDADELVPPLIEFLKTCGATRVEAVGEYRRRVETIGALEFLVQTDDFDALVEQFTAHGGGAQVIDRSPHRAVFRLGSGLALTIEESAATHWGLMLIETTGSEKHLAQLEERSPALSEVATQRGKKYSTEAQVYKALGLQPIEPELREGNDEIARAARGELPRLVRVQDIRGELHAHTTSSDGAASIEEMVEAARARGYEYLGITDHSQSLKIASGVSEKDLWKQIRAIDRLNERLRGFRVLKAAEVDILVDGSLDYSDAVLRELDYTICSIHSRFALNKEQQTTRILRAMEHPSFAILGHATGRLLLRRPGYDIDLDRLIIQAKASGCFFEINSSPDRLDLRAEHARRVREAGIPLAICTDAHSTPELDYIRCGVDQARRAALEPKDVLNTLPLRELLAKLQQRRR